MNPLLQQKITTNGPVYSFHAFLFPFEWSYKEQTARLLEEETSLTRLAAWMKDDAHWERRSSWLKPQSLAQFNEVAYFYEFVRPVLYDSGNDKSLQCHYYFRLPGEKPEYVIELPDGTTYRLAIDDIVVSYYDMGVGVLAFHLLNTDRDQSSPADIQRINFFGRRVYPPFLGTDMDKVGQQAFFEDFDWAEGLRRTVSDAKELARSIRLESKGDIWAADYFQSWLTNQDLDREPDLIEQILPLSLRGRVVLEPVLDDRMYVVCWYGNDALCNLISGADPTSNYKTHDWWYSYVFVDREWKTCENKEMMQELLTSATYARWANYGTFYGISRYSFVALTNEMEQKEFMKLLFTHTQTLYYKLALLCLVQRACLLRFSDEITAISQLDKSDRQIGERVGSLYKQYLRFVNKIYFREVTAQEQGIEIYDIMQHQMRLPQQVTALQEEMKELHQYAMIIEEDRRNDKLDILTYIGAFFVVPSFIGTYFGISDYDLSGQWIWISFFCLLSAGLAFAAIRATGARRMVWLGLLIILMVLILFIFPTFGVWE